MSGFLAMTWNGFREARRNRVTTVVFAFAFASLLSTTLVMNITVSTFDRVATDFGLGMMNILLVFLAIFLSSGLLPREIERRTIFLIVSKPLARWAFVCARLLGNILTLTVLLGVMAVIFRIQCAMFKINLSDAAYWAVAGLGIELVVLSTIGVFFSTFSGQFVAALCTIGIYVSGHFSRDIYKLADKSDSEALKYFGKFIYFCLPNLERLNYKYQATYQIAASEFSGDAIRGFAYGLAFASFFCIAACIVFERRDFK